MEFKEIRRAQTISPFGVGAVLDIEGESLVAADITYWKGAGVEIHEPRLERQLQVKKFMMAPAAPEYMWQRKESSPGVPYVRFPTWVFCSSCRSMFRRFSTKNAPICPECSGEIKLTPMRFVVACPRGHLLDVPWNRWAHSLKGTWDCKDPELEFFTKSGGSGLEFVFVRCKTCKASRSLSGIASPDSLKKLRTKCTGHHPWVRWENREDCDAIPQVLQRGATNLTFSIIDSSIDIPPHSRWQEFSQDSIRVTNDEFFGAIRSAWDSEQFDFVEIAIINLASRLEMSEDTVRSIINKECGGELKQDIPLSDPEDFLFEEYEALIATGTRYDPRDRFIKRDVNLSAHPSPDSPEDYKQIVESLKDYLDGVVQVTRLREVRAMKGFSRLSPPTQTADMDDEPPGRFSTYSDRKIPPLIVPADLNGLPRTNKWLPAIEVFGEGIFIRLNEAKLQLWETNANVQQRIAILMGRRNENAGYLPIPRPRLVLLHTLAHLLIRQLSFECGYSIASLRERIYSRGPGEDGEPMAGILIYTAAGDSEGTLGGLVRMGEADRILTVILKTIQIAEWCSSDPLCRESQGQGLHALNLAACHACSLLPETSCTMSNRLLDRVLLLGSQNGVVDGFFTSLLDQVLSIGQEGQQ